MFEIKVTVDIPDLVKAAQMLVEAKKSDLQAVKILLDELRSNEPAPQLGLQAALQAKNEEPVAPYTAPAVPLPEPTPVIPVAAMPAEQQAVSTTTTALTPVVPPVAAPTAAPAYTLAQVAKAGAELLTAKPALIPQLQELLNKYGASTAQELPLDRLGEFAAELRALGARI